jgi:hypothetical protein
MFKPNGPLQQSILFNPNLFGKNQSSLNIFKRNIEDPQTSQMQDLNNNLRQIQMFKQFVEKQMMMDLLSH